MNLTFNIYGEICHEDVQNLTDFSSKWLFTPSPICPGPLAFHQPEDLDQADTLSWLFPPTQDALDASK